MIHILVYILTLISKFTFVKALVALSVFGQAYLYTIASL